MKVRATMLGFYNMKRQKPGSVFHIKDEKHFSENWMEKFEEKAEKKAADKPVGKPSGKPKKDDNVI